MHTIIGFGLIIVGVVMFCKILDYYNKKDS